MKQFLKISISLNSCEFQKISFDSQLALLHTVKFKENTYIYTLVFLLRDYSDTKLEFFSPESESTVHRASN